MDKPRRIAFKQKQKKTTPKIVTKQVMCNFIAMHAVSSINIDMFVQRQFELKFTTLLKIKKSYLLALFTVLVLIYIFALLI